MCDVIIEVFGRQNVEGFQKSHKLVSLSLYQASGDDAIGKIGLCLDLGWKVSLRTLGHDGNDLKSNVLIAIGNPPNEFYMHRSTQLHCFI